MAKLLPSKLMLVGILSLATSLVLALIPFASPTMPIGLIVFANWALFMSVSYFASPKPLRFLPPYPRMEKFNQRLWSLAFLSFTAAGWLAMSMGQPL